MQPGRLAAARFLGALGCGMAQNDSHSDSSARKGGWLDWIERHPKTVWAVFILVVLAGVWFALEAAGQARLKRAMAAIRAKGEPLTAEELQRQVPVIADDRNMALVLLEKGKAIQLDIESPALKSRSSDLPALGGAKGVKIGVRLPPEQSSTAREFLTRNAAEISSIEATTELGDGVYPIVWMTPAIKVLLPQLSVHRLVGKALLLKAIVASEDGKSADAMVDLSAMAALDAAMKHEATLVGLLVRIACQHLTCDGMLRCIALTPFSDSQLKQLDARIAAFEAPGDLHTALLAERAICFDTMTWAYRGGNLAGILGGGPPTTMLRFVPSLKGIDPAIYLEIATQYCDAATLPPAKAMAAVFALETRAADLPFYAVTAKILTPSVSRAFALWHRSRAVVLATRVAIAAERYRLKHGAWPPGLEELVPEYLPSEAIVDPMSGKPLVYRRDGDGIRVYSVGEDGVDDGGVMDREQARGARVAFDPGVFLPNPELRNLASTTQASKP